MFARLVRVGDASGGFRHVVGIGIDGWSKSQRFGDVVSRHRFDVVEIGDGARHAQHAVIGACGERQSVGGADEQRAGVTVKSGDGSEQSGRRRGVGHPTIVNARGAEPSERVALLLAPPGQHDARAHGRRAFGGEMRGQRLRGDALHGHMQIDAIGQWPRQA